MPEAITLSIRELPTRYQDHPAIEARLWQRAEVDEKEVLFSYREQPSPALLPVIYNEEFRIVRWGNGERHSHHIPATGTIHVNDLRKSPGSACSP